MWLLLFVLLSVILLLLFVVFLGLCLDADVLTLPFKNLGQNSLVKASLRTIQLLVDGK